MAKEKRDAGLIQVKVRMPIALHRKLVRDAARQALTVNAEILMRLEESYSAYEVAKSVQAALIHMNNALSWMVITRKAEKLKALAQRLSDLKPKDESR